MLRKAGDAVAYFDQGQGVSTSSNHTEKSCPPGGRGISTGDLTMPNDHDQSLDTASNGHGTRYTCFFLLCNGHWSDARDIFAMDDVEALGIAILMADDKHFELWDGIRLVHWPTDGLHRGGINV
jgi:hypothetical protein